MDQIFSAIGDAINSVFDNPVVQLGFKLAVIYWILLWLAASYWAFRDMQSRSDNPLAPYLAAAFVIIRGVRDIVFGFRIREIENGL